MSLLEKQIGDILAGMTDTEKKELDKLLAKELESPWLPTPGPQLEAYYSEADLLLFGGAAGGGKSDLICGLCLTQHYRSVVFRRQSSDLNGFWDRLLAICVDPVKKNTNLKQLSTKDDRYIECGHLEAPGAERAWQGRDHDLVAFDEGAQISPYKINFVLGWLRSAHGHRCRAIIASNPPIGGEGAFLVEWFAPWLDPMYQNPALPGELRWAITVGDANELRTIWVDGSDQIYMNTDFSFRIATQDEIDARPQLDQIKKPLSRTFIPSRLDDNPYLRNTNYRAQLNSMPEPLRSQLLHGDFIAGREDDEWQVIPSAWIKAAQARWKEPHAKTRMIALGVDVAQGGKDSSVFAPLYADNTFDKIESRPGRETPDGPSIASLILKFRRDGAAIAIDTTGGWGGSARDHLKTHHQIAVMPIVYSAGADGMDASSKLSFGNLRAKMYWMFRVALDPSLGENIALPPGDRIVTQLTAARWSPKSGRIVIESKEDIRARLGSSPDEADAIVQAWHVRKQAYKAKPAARSEPIAPNRLGWLG